MVKHIVFWNIKDSDHGKTKSQLIADIKSRIEALINHIPEILEIEVGTDFNGSDQAFDVALYSSFKTKQDLNTYQLHPEHQKVAQYVKSVTTARAVVDYEI
jgi:hypothetical protein